MERYSLLSAPLSSMCSSPVPGPQSAVVRSAAGAACMPHHSPPANQVARSGNDNADLSIEVEVDMASTYSDSESS